MCSMIFNMDHFPERRKPRKQKGSPCTKGILIAVATCLLPSMLHLRYSICCLCSLLHLTMRSLRSSIIGLAIRQCAAWAFTLINQNIPERRNLRIRSKPVYTKYIYLLRYVYFLPGMFYLRYSYVLSLLPPTSYWSKSASKLHSHAIINKIELVLYSYNTRIFFAFFFNSLPLTAGSRCDFGRYVIGGQQGVQSARQEDEANN